MYTCTSDDRDFLGAITDNFVRMSGYIGMYNLNYLYVVYLLQAEKLIKRKLSMSDI